MKGGVDGSKGPRDAKNLDCSIEKDGARNNFRLDMREVSYGFVLLEIPIVNPKTVGGYWEELRARVYIKAFKHLNR